MESVTINTNDTEKVNVDIKDGSLNPLTGKTDILLSIKRESDGYWYDFDDDTFKNSGWTTQQEAMSETDVTRFPGRYHYDFDTSAITNPSSEDIYSMRVVQSPGTDAKNVPQEGELRVRDNEHVYSDGVYLDTTGAGVAGTDFPIGTRIMPSSNLADTITIATAKNTKKLNLNGDLTLSQSVAGYVIEGIGDKNTYTITLNGQNTTGTLFISCAITGAQSGAFTAKQCLIGAVTNASFKGEEIVVTGNITAAVGGTIEINVGAAQSLLGTVFDMNGVSLVSLTKFDGIIECTNLTNVSGAFVSSGSIILTINASCTDGLITCSGFGIVTNNATGPTVSKNMYPDDLFEVTVSGHQTVGTLGEVIRWMAARGAGGYEIDDVNNQIFWTDPDGVTEALRFDTTDKNGNPAVTNIYKRERV